MAISPCLRCQQRFTGPALNLYLSTFDHDQREAYRFVVCFDCASELLTEWRTYALYRDADGQWEYHDPGEGPVAQKHAIDAREPHRNGRGDLQTLPWDAMGLGPQNRGR